MNREVRRKFEEDYVYQAQSIGSGEYLPFRWVTTSSGYIFVQNFVMIWKYRSKALLVEVWARGCYLSVNSID